MDGGVVRFKWEIVWNQHIILGAQLLEGICSLCLLLSSSFTWIITSGKVKKLQWSHLILLWASNFPTTLISQFNVEQPQIWRLKSYSSHLGALIFFEMHCGEGVDERQRCVFDPTELVPYPYANIFFWSFSSPICCILQHPRGLLLD